MPCIHPREIALIILILDFMMFLIVCSIAGAEINRSIDSARTPGMREDALALPTDPSFPPAAFKNPATGYFVIFSLISGMVGIASSNAGYYHIAHWIPQTLPLAASCAFTSWLLTIVAMGFGMKEIQGAGTNPQMRTMEAFVIILSFSQFLYLLAIHAPFITELRPGAAWFREEHINFSFS